MAYPDRRNFLIAAGMTAGWAASGVPFAADAQSSQSLEKQQVDLALVLAADCSGSVSSEEYTLQQQGYADAFRQREVIKAIRSGIHGRIAACYFQWSGYSLQQLIVPWAVLRSDDSISTFATALQHAERRLYSGGTAPGGAIAFGGRLLDNLPWIALRKVIDISGDGRTNTGPSPDQDRAEVLARGVTINGLPIENQEPDLEEYYRLHVIGGPGAFLVPARDFEAFKEAVRRKLVQEIAGLSSGTA
jgi:hypothetical protein